MTTPGLAQPATLGGSPAGAPARGAAAPAREARPPSTPPRSRRAWVRARSTALVVLALGLVVTAGLASASRLNYLHNQRHLIRLQTELTAAALSSAPVDIEQRLGTAVGLAAVTGRSSEFRGSIASSVGRAGPFVDARLYHLSGTRLDLEAAVGATPLLAASSASSSRLAARAERSSSLAVTRVVTSGAQRLVYAEAARGPGGVYVGYAEEKLPADRRVSIASGSPIEGLNAALYFGRPSAADLVLTDAAHLPLRGTTARARIPFGQADLTLVVSARQPLAGSLAELMPWLIIAAGVVLSLLGAGLVDRLQRRRLVAEALAAEVRELYGAERHVAETLQHSLLPQQLQAPPGYQVAVRYKAGTVGTDVGGDWYDLICLDDGRRAVFSVGDVAGRGLRAAVVMSSLRNAILAHARDGDPPQTILTKLDRMLDIPGDGRFATVVCGLLETTTGVVHLSLAGHPPPVLLTASSCRPLEVPVGRPIGLGGPRSATTVDLPAGATLLAYTDGLIERRDRALSAGIERLCAAASDTGSLDALLDRVLETLVPEGPSDDVALLGLRRAR